jgi:hypothetical protein
MEPPPRRHRGRGLAAAPPDRSALGRLRRATYVGGTLSSLRDGTEGNLSFADRARLLFLAAEGGAASNPPAAGRVGGARTGRGPAGR